MHLPSGTFQLPLPMVLVSAIWFYLLLKAQAPFPHSAQSRRDGQDMPGKAPVPFLQPVPLSQSDAQDASCLLSLSPATSRVSPGTENVQVSNRTISIFVNGVYGWPGAGLVPSCPVPCKITTDSKEILANWRTADIVIWNMQALVCGTMGAKWETKPLGQKWVANYDFETLPSGPAESLSPIVPGIDWTAHFQKDSDWAISCWTFFGKMVCRFLYIFVMSIVSKVGGESPKRLQKPQMTQPKRIRSLHFKPQFFSELLVYLLKRHEEKVSFSKT